MSTDEPGSRPRPLKLVRSQASEAVGRGAAERIQAFTDGTLYVEATWGAVILAWLVDFLLVTAIAIGAAAAYYTAAPAYADPAVGAAVIGAAGLVVVPLLYGWFYGGGRGLGALLAGTRLVRIKDGSRVGLAKAGWAMLLRTLGFVIIALGALGGDSTDANQVRVSIDVRATQRLRAAGYHRLPA
ncbi:hypothetical protein ABZ816_15180 [Actinosynnema sp. NPDC047251]|uniref:Putative membrane protein n=1 Tax=Saccharothrix espanaensis (strain ATCC 51144 / DSM 44229 / JCM 9112 / NBRC 15066 / NRRL 15764) TaxID=1179773 RepID=K0JZF5_SACES|nr:hypothetical protein [Saccharothrix espanaensis]CCH29638.1 putative membrane protein [Saccharothrix espanaensis DSM 44229]